MNLDEKEVSDLLKKIFTPILLTLGISGNLFSIIIFSQASMKKHTTFKYLLLLSILDLCVLFTGCGDLFLEVYFKINVRLINEFSCKIHSFMVIFFTHSSSMLLVCMSVDRVVVIKMKMATKLSSPKVATRIFIAILVLIGILNIHLLLFTHLIKNEYKPESGLLNSSLAEFEGLNRSSNFTYEPSVLQELPYIYFCYGNDTTTYYIYLIGFHPW